jgi:uncharacterized protein YecT (DUF1311 family)
MPFLSTPCISFALAVALLAPQVQAQTRSDQLQAQTQSEMNASAARDYRAADAALNDAWDGARLFGDAIGQGDALLAAQRLWLAYRDAACEVQASPLTGGTLQPMVQTNCLTTLTEERTRMLLEFNGY